MPFLWRDADIYVFSIRDGVDFRAVLTFNELKGMGGDKSTFKSVVVSTLSTRSAIHDSIRLILILGLIVGVFAHGISSWSDFERLRPSESGSMLRIKPDMMKTPVFRRSNDRHLPSLLPEIHANMLKDIARLRYACGYQKRLSAYAWRRGAAFHRDEVTTAENRKFIMGHKSHSEVYSHYLSRVAAVDLQAASRGMDQHDLTNMMSVGLNKKNNAPTRVSESSYAAVLASPSYVALQSEVQSLSDNILADHCSIAAASRSGDPRFQEYQHIYYKLDSLKRSLIQREFPKEYDAFFVETGCSQDPVEPDHLRYAENDKSDGISHLLAIQDSTGLDSQVNPSSPIPVDLSLPESTASIGQTTRLHGLPNKPAAYQRMHAGSARYYVGTTLCDDLYDLLTKGTNETDLAETATQCFAITHRVDAFFPGQEPSPGTFSCPQCGVDLNGIDGNHPHYHTFRCTQRAIEAETTKKVEGERPLDAPCQFQKPNRSGNLADCGTICKSWRSLFNHIQHHLKRSYGRDDGDKSSAKMHYYCFFKGCAVDSSPCKRSKEGFLGQRSDPYFDTLDELRAHLKSEHHVIRSERGTVDAGFCLYCERWIDLSDNFVDHIVQHKIDAVELIRTSGYESVKAGRPLRPDLCMFCFHDVNLPWYKRIKPPGQRGLKTSHYHKHLSQLPDVTHCPAYPDFCTYGTAVNHEDLSLHLIEEHGIPKLKTSSKRKSAVLKEKTRMPGKR